MTTVRVEEVEALQINKKVARIGNIYFRRVGYMQLHEKIQVYYNSRWVSYMQVLEDTGHYNSR